MLDYDMLDLPERGRDKNKRDLLERELDTRWPALRPVLTAIDKQVLPIYLASDQGAIRARNWHWRTVRFAAISGTAAVMMSIFELWELSSREEGHDHHQPLPLHLVGRLLALFGADPGLAGGGIELVLAVAALVSVAVGVFAAWHKGWLHQRYTAEQCRGIKFRMLLDPARWVGKTLEEIQAELAKDIENLNLPRDLKCCTEHHIEQWVLRDFSPPLKHPELAEYRDFPADLGSVEGQIVEYCRDKRLRLQARYFESQAERREARERWSRYIVPCAFFLSIIAASLHFSLDFNSLERNAAAEPGWWSRFLMMIAALLPVAAACVRTLRTAQEFGRNSLRFKSLKNELNELDLRLNRKTGSDRLWTLRAAETALDVEHRSWMRLMTEAEWFG
jgi:hypothetical protein